MKLFGKLILAGVGLVVFAGIIYKKYKEEDKKLKKEKKFIDKKLETYGITQKDLDRVPERIRKSKSDSEPGRKHVDNDNLVLKMYNVVENGSSELNIDPWDRDLIRIRSEKDRYGKITGAKGCLDCENIIHVKQSDIGGKEHLEFIFEIPTSAYDDRKFNSLKIRDYTNTLHEAAEFINKEYLGMEEVFNEDTEKFEVPFKHHIEGYYLVSYKIKGVTEIRSDGKQHPKIFQKMIPISREDSNRYSSLLDTDERMNSTEKFVKYLYKHLKDSPIDVFEEEDSIIQVKFFSKEVKESKESPYDLTIEAPFLMFRIAIPIAKTENDEGVDLDSALEILRYFSEELIIKNSRKHRDVKDLSINTRYNHILFHAKDLDCMGNEGFDMLQYYTVTCEDINDVEFRYRKLIVEQLVYERFISENDDYD